MAFDIEVFNSEAPLVVAYYYKETADTFEAIAQLQELALQYTTIKFVLIDADKLYSLAQSVMIQNFPVALLIKKEEIIDCFENVTLAELQQKLSEYLT